MKKKEINGHLKQIWDIFEKTGCISAYLLYKDLCKKSNKKPNIKKILIKK